MMPTPKGMKVTKHVSKSTPAKKSMVKAMKTAAPKNTTVCAPKKK